MKLKSKRPKRATAPPSKATAYAGFPVVGIGASAGGLEAFTKLLKHLPSNTGMAFVLVQHLSPQYESFLSEILSKVTLMPVVEVTNGMRVEQNHVYVIPPNVSMAIENSFLRLVPREEHERPHLAIDFFFRTLANDQKNDAIGVVLSGTGSDGAEGLKSIKGEGGLSFAQSPESARFGGMPQRAIAVDHVDFVLAPEEIAKELVKISKHPYLKEPKEIQEIAPSKITDEKNEIDKILHLIKQSTGVDFSQYKRNTVYRRIMRRMVIQKVEKISVYYSFLKDDRNEQTALQNDILINVTSFFRDPDVFESMKTIVFPALIKGRKKGDPIRVWVPGCATGEEPYSIAIALLEFLGDKITHFPVQIFGSDLSDSCIAKARAGRYTDGISEAVSRERLNRYFVRSDKGFLVTKAVRDLCVFARQDVVKDPPYSRLDLISCRNLLIYLEPVLQRGVLTVFNYALKPKGFLVLGKSETPSLAAPLFSTVDKRHKIYSANPSRSHLRPVFASAVQPLSALTQTPRGATPSLPVDPIEKETDQMIVTHYAPPSVVINENLEVIQFRGDTSPFLINQSRRASFNILKMAKEGLAPALKVLIETAKKSGTIATSGEIKTRSDGGARFISLEAVPLRTAAQHWFILFREVPGGALEEPPKSKRKSAEKRPRTTKSEAIRITTLSRELADTKAYLESLNRDLESTNQDLQSANEEVLSANEELQSTNEELETAKEELQSGNEELTTVNDELQSRNAELDRLNNDLINLLGSIEIPILMIGKDGRVRKLTPAAQNALSLQGSDIGRPIREIKSNFEVLGLDLNLEQKVNEVVESTAVTETEIQDRHGHWFRLQVRPYRTLDNRVDGAVVALIDIDALKRSLAEIESARSEAEKARASAEAGNRAKDLFLAVLSHELRTPLTTILSFSQLLRLGRLGPEEARKGILMIEQSAQAQAQLINDLLDVSRIMMGKLSLDVQDVDPTAVLHAAVESVRPLADRKSIRIHERTEEKTVSVRGDAARLKQVFLNLLTNAIKFSAAEGEIKVNLDVLSEPVGESVRVRISDFGKGISAKFLPHLFDRFSQADSSSTRIHGGMGLGLAIVRSLVEAQSGTVRAESEGEGKGATFTVTFPAIWREPIGHEQGRSHLSLASFEAEARKSKDREHPDLNGIKILFVDDDPSARESLGALLTSLGAEVSVVDSAQAAMEALPKIQPDILISDLAMPGEDGFSLIERVRRLSPKQQGQIPAIALTAFAGLEDTRRTLAAGFQVHLAKPVDSFELAKAISELTSR